MFTVYIDYDKMYDICCEQDYNNGWYKILSKQSVINTNHTDDDEFNDEDNPLMVFSQMYGIEFNDTTSYMNEVLADNSKVLEQPCGAFILNIDSDKAKEIQSRYGVICQSVADMDSKVLTQGDITITTIKSNTTWESRLNYGKQVPSNSMIIVDRYLFGSEYGETLQDSYDNIKDILAAFIPESFAAEYHIFIIFDAEQIQPRDIWTLLGSDKSKGITEDDRKKAFAKISTQVNKIKKEYANKYGCPITLEMLSCDKRDIQSYNKIHDRWVVSNYFYVTASHKLKAFRNGQPLKKQKIDLLTLYAKGLSDMSDIPESAHKDNIEDLQYIMREAKNHPLLHLYSVNGNVNSSLRDAKNRILV